MSCDVTVRVLSVRCNDKESGPDNSDAFILMGAVVVDRQVHPFGFETVALRSNEYFPYEQDVFTGIIEAGPLGLALSGWETDRSADWYNVREDVAFATEKVGTFVNALPLPYHMGEIAGFVIEKIPAAVDFFDELDDDDNIFKWAGELPQESMPENTITRVYTFNSRGATTVAGAITLSDWDYDITVAVTWRELAPSFPPVVEARWTYVAKDKSKARQWLGHFENGPIRCFVSPSGSVVSPLKISFSDENGQHYDIERTGVANTSISLDRVDVAHGPVFRPESRPLPRHPNSNATGFSRIYDRPPVLLGGGEPSSEISEVAEVSPLLRLGGDRVALPNGGILEICDTLANGQRTGAFALRYVRPANVDSILLLSSADVDVMLTSPGPNLG